MISIGNTIKTLRKAKGITQEEVARELGVSYQAVSKYENEVAQPDISREWWIFYQYRKFLYQCSDK